MNTIAFQELLLRSAVCVIACDGKIDEVEVEEIHRMAENEIFFMGYEYNDYLEKFLMKIKNEGLNEINNYLFDLSNQELSEKQELILIEVLIKSIESDKIVEKSEIKFLQMVKSKLKVSEEIIISRFPKQINYLIDFNNYGLHKEFTEETIN